MKKAAAPRKAGAAKAPAARRSVKPAARIFNFGAGPATMPVEVLEKAKWELVNWHEAGMSVMEMSHRGKEFVAIAAEAEADLRKLLAVPANYKVLFLQGGATAQFAAVPMNLLRGARTIDVVNTGVWSQKVIAEGRKFAQVNVVASSEDRNFTYVPKQAAWKRSPDAAYLHVCTNETIGGVEFPFTPDTGSTPLVADMSSHILSRPFDVSKFAVIYAGAQKNIGPAGATAVMVREDFLASRKDDLPSMLDYRTHVGEMYNTPPVFAVYIIEKVLRWIEDNGGLRAMTTRNDEKAARLYAAIDATEFYRGTAQPASRSKMNVTYRLPSEELEALFVKESKAAGLVGLKGHRSVGGIRASIHNAVAPESVDALIAFMRDFERRNG